MMPFTYVHQVPGGMITNLTSCYPRRNMGHRIGEVLEEISVIREEWGYPVMITPFSQIVGTQAVLNVLLGERYKTTTAEGARYVFGHYGKTPAPVEPNVLDRMSQTAEGKKFMNWGSPNPTSKICEKEMAGWGLTMTNCSFGFFCKKHAHATQAAGPIQTRYPRGQTLDGLDRGIGRSQRFSQHPCSKKDFSLKLQKSDVHC